MKIAHRSRAIILLEGLGAENLLTIKLEIIWIEIHIMNLLWHVYDCVHSASSACPLEHIRKSKFSPSILEFNFLYQGKLSYCFCIVLNVLLFFHSGQLYICLWQVTRCRYRFSLKKVHQININYTVFGLFLFSGHWLCWKNYSTGKDSCDIFSPFPFLETKV